MKKIGILLIALATTTSAFANPCCDEPPSSCFAGYVDFLWWDACGDQLDYGILTSGTLNPGAPNIATLSEKLFVFDSDWSPGVRIGVTREMDCSPFSWFAEWTWFKTNGKRETTLTPPQGSNVIYSFTPDFFSTPRFFDSGFVNADFCFQINRVDVGIASFCCACDQIVIRPFVAGTFAQTNEDIHLKAEFSDSSELPFSQQNNYKTETTFYGAGAKIGLALDWQFSKCISFYTEGGITGLWGKFDFRNKALQNLSGIGFAEVSGTATFKYDEWCGRFLSQIQLGLRYHKTWCNDRAFYAQLGWEHQALFNQTNWLLRQTEFASQGSKSAANLILQGLVARVGVGY